MRSLVATAGAASLVAGLVVLTTSSPALGEWVPGPELVVNGSFEDGTTGWRTNGGSDTPLDRVNAGIKSDHAARIQAGIRRNLVLNDATNTVVGTEAGTRYRVQAQVRADQKVSGELRVREVTQKIVTVNRERFRIEPADGWQKVSFDFTVDRDASNLDVNVIAWDARPGQSLHVENVSMVELVQQGSAPKPKPEPTPPGTTSPTPEPTTPAPETTDPTDPVEEGQMPSPEPSPSAPTPTAPEPTVPAETEPPAPEPGTAGTLSNGCEYSARGIPECGAYFGAALGSNDDPTSLEKQAGQRFGVRRTFWQGSQVSAAVRTAEADIAAGRLPWLSFKLPSSWEEMAKGAGDAWAKDLAQRLAGLNGPVWVAFHHEPETDGDIKQWTAIQKRLAPIVRSTAPNVAYTIILTGWHQVSGDTAQYGLDVLWPKGTKVDVVGFDIYNRFGTPQSNRNEPYDLRKEFFEELAGWSKANGVPWAIGEIGYTDATAKADPDWLQTTYDDLVDLDGIAMSYFSSSLNATGDWLLDTADRKDQFVNVLQGTPLLPVS